MLSPTFGWGGKAAGERDSDFAMGEESKVEHFALTKCSYEGIRALCRRDESPPLSEPIALLHLAIHRDDRGATEAEIVL